MTELEYVVLYLYYTSNQSNQSNIKSKNDSIKIS